LPLALAAGSGVPPELGYYLCDGRAKESLAQFDAAIRNPPHKTPEIPLVNAGRCATSIGDTVRQPIFARRARANNDAVARARPLPIGKPGSARLIKNMRRRSCRPSYLDVRRAQARDRQAEASYVAQLRNRYPEADETKAIATGNCE
jgi:type IV pilus assembly protein PilF